MRILLIALTLLVFCSLSVFAQMCGDVNSDFMVNIEDIMALWDYIHGVDPVDIGQGNVNAACIYNIADVVYLGQYIYAEGPEPNCADTAWCDYTTVGSEIVSVEPPPYTLYPSSDSFPVQVYITNTSSLYGVSMGFHYSSNDIEITSINTTGTVASGGLGFKDSYNSVDNEALVTWAGNSLMGNISTQNEGLFVTLNIQKLTGTPEDGFDLEPAFYPPGGNFIFVQTDMTTFRPAYTPPFINTIYVTNLDDSGVGSLRWALGEANTIPGPDAIEFSVSGTINLASTLPPINDDNTIILGPSAPSGSHSVILDGTGLGQVGGLTIHSDYNIIKGLTIINWETPCITISGSDNAIEDCHINVNSAGDTRQARGGHGIFIYGDRNRVGGNDEYLRNIIACSDDSCGILIMGDYNDVFGNYIGLSSTGGALNEHPSGFTYGVWLDNANYCNVGDITALGNYIAGFSTGIGVSNGTENQIANNYLGLVTNLSDTIPNITGIVLNATSKHNTIGPNNAVAGSFTHGIYFPIGCDSNFVRGNTIIGNSGNGIIFTSGPLNNQIGGSNPEDENVICYNAINGIYLYGNTDHTLIKGNSIFSNTLSGINIEFNCDSNTIEQNTIYDNMRDGITVTINSLYNSMSMNQIYQNSQTGIDLSDDGVTSNDPGDADTGPNDLLNYPELDSLYMNLDSSFTAHGSAATNAIIEFFVAHPVGDDTKPADPTGYGEAYSFIGTDTADGGGKFVFDIAKEIGQFSAITMTATDVNGNTSEFSDNYMLIASPLIVVGYADSPDLINLKVTDPDGYYIGKDADGVLGQTLFPATYDEIVNDSITIVHPIQGVYLIEVIGETGAAMRGVYAVGIRIDGTNEVIIAANTPVPDPGESDSFTYEVEEDWHFINGDANRDGIINILDIVYLINYKYKGGPAPYPLMAGEIDCIDPINILDIVYLINFKYKHGPEPCATLE